jgi:hypothetical protein
MIPIRKAPFRLLWQPPATGYNLSHSTYAKEVLMLSSTNFWMCVAGLIYLVVGYDETAALRISRQPAARLAAILPAPLKRRPERMNSYSAIILNRMGQMGW